MLCQGKITFKERLYHCQNITNQKLCEECSNTLLEGGKYGCLYYHKHFKCPNLTNNCTRICYYCRKDHETGHYLESTLKSFAKNNLVSFNIYLRSFDWDQKFLNDIFIEDLMDYDKFFINCKNLTNLKPNYKLLERYFLIKQLFLPELIFQVMFPNIISPISIWNKYFSEVITNPEQIELIYDQVKTIINKVNNDKLTKEDYFNFMADEGYKILHTYSKLLSNNLTFKETTIKHIIGIGLNNINNIRTKNFIYSLTGIDL